MTLRLGLMSLLQVRGIIAFNYTYKLKGKKQMLGTLTYYVNTSIASAT